MRRTTRSAMGSMRSPWPLSVFMPHPFRSTAQPEPRCAARVQSGCSPWSAPACRPIAAGSTTSPDTGRIAPHPAATDRNRMSPDNRDDRGDVRAAAGLHPCRMGSLLAARLAWVFGPKRIEIGVSGQPPRGPWSRKGFDLRALWCWLWIWLYGLWWWYWPPRARCRCVRMVIGMCVRMCVRIPSALRSGLCGLAFRHRLVYFGLRSRVGPTCLRLDPELGKH